MELHDIFQVNRKQKTPVILGFLECDRGRIRTFDRLLRRQMLYPAELRDLAISCRVAKLPVPIYLSGSYTTYFAGANIQLTSVNFQHFPAKCKIDLKTFVLRLFYEHSRTTYC